MKITDEAVEKAVKGYDFATDYRVSVSAMRAALEAALPHLLPATAADEEVARLFVERYVADAEEETLDAARYDMQAALAVVRVAERERCLGKARDYQAADIIGPLHGAGENFAAKIIAEAIESGK